MIFINESGNEIPIEDRVQMMNRLQALANSEQKHNISCNIVDTQFKLTIWFINERTQCILFYNPLDELEDCQISSSRDEAKMDAPWRNVHIGENSIDCSAYNIISTKEALQNITEVLYNKVEFYSSPKWMSY